MLLVIDSEPIAQGRPRLSTRGGHARAYDPNAAEKSQVRGMIQSHMLQSLQHKNIQEHYHRLMSAEGYVLKMTFFCTYPKNVSKKFEKLCTWGLCPRTAKPDLDNYIKFYLDCLNGIVFKDDSKVISLEAKKFYSSTPRVVIQIMEDGAEVFEKAKMLLSLIDQEEFCELAKSIGVVAKSLQEAESSYREVLEADRLAAACMLSQFAELYGKLFTTIQKKFPNLCQEICEIHDFEE